MGSNQSTQSVDQEEVLPSVVTTPQQYWSTKIDDTLNENQWFDVSKVVVQPISGVPGAFVLKGVVSEAEADAMLSGILEFIEEQEKIPFQPVFFRSWASGPDADAQKSLISQRMIAKVDHMATELYSRLHTFLSPEESVENSKEREKWALHSFSNRLRFVKTTVGQHFPRHTDGSQSIGDSMKTFHSVVIYLNSGAGQDYTGGELTMYKVAEEKSMGKMATTNWEVAASIPPAKGDVVVFPHGSFHEAMEVTQGIKYLVRIDPIYEKISTVDI